MTKLSFSERKKLAAEGLPPFSYKLTKKARMQIALLFQHFEMDDYWRPEVQGFVKNLVRTIKEKHGLVDIGDNRPIFSRHDTDLIEWHAHLLYGEQSSDEFLDCVEYGIEAMAYISVARLRYSGSSKPVDAFEALRDRINEALMLEGVGYRIEGTSLVRVTSDAVHEMAIEPALTLTREQGFQGANEEFKAALQHLRTNAFKDATTSARRALEATLKEIANRKAWTDSAGQPLSGKETLKPLLSLAFSTGFIPAELQASFNNLRPFLESTVPPLTNPGSHGHALPFEVPVEVAEFAVATVGTTIVFLIKLLGKAS